MSKVASNNNNNKYT